MQDDFNKTAPAAAGRGNSGQPLPLLRAAIGKTRENLAMVEAAKKADWDALRRHLDAGADPTFQDNAALQELIKDISPKAVALMQDIKHPAFSTLPEFPLVLAASKNDMTLVDSLLKQGKASRETVESAAFTALRRGHKDIAGRLLPLLPPDDYSDKLLIALLLDDPARYDAAMAVQKAPHEELVHFINACAVKDEKAIDHMLDRMIAQKTPGAQHPLILMGMDGIVPYEEVLSYLFQSGHTGAIDRYLDNFEEFCPSRATLLHIAAVVGDEEAKLFTHLIDKLKPAESDVTFITFFAAAADKRPHLKAVVEAFPALAARHPDVMMISAVTAGEADAFFTLMQNGGTLPEDDGKRIELLRLSMERGLEDVTGYILQNTPATPELIARMQSNYHGEIQRQSAVLSGDWRFEKDKLFWRALDAPENTDVLKRFEAVTDISPASPYQVELALTAVIKRNDAALLEHVLAHTDWAQSGDARLRAHRACLATPETAEKAAVLLTGEERRALEAADLRMMTGENFPATLAVLERQGFALPDDLLAQALPLAVKDKNAGMAEYLLGRGVTLAAAEDDIARAIAFHGDTPLLDMLEKWAAREQTRPAALPADLSEKPALFGGADCPAIRAAYGDRFDQIMAGADAAFDPQLLVTTKDAHGNTVLDILGAHGRLDDVLVADVWKDRDAAGFIRSQTPPRYHAQCDFDGLSARIRQAGLLARGKNRFVLKGSPKK